MTTQTNIRQTDFLPTRFTGDKLDRDRCTAHILSFDDYLDAHDIDHTKPDNFQTILKFFKRTLQGQARLWINDLTFTDYDDLKLKFIRRFSPAKSTFAHAHDFNNLTMTHGESTEAFLHRLRQTANYIHYGETQIKHKLLDSLPTDCRTTILMSTDPNTTCDEIAAKAQLYFDLKSNAKTTKNELSFSAQSEIDSIKEQINALKLDLKSDQTENQNRRPPTPRPRSTERSSSRDRDRRQNSHDRQHDANGRRGRSPYRNDHHDRRPRSRSRPRPTCFYCHIPGHVWRECRKRLRDASTTQQTQPQYFDQQHHYNYNPYHNTTIPQQYQQQQPQQQYHAQQDF